MRRRIPIGFLVLLCLALATATWSKGRKLGGLRQKQRGLLAQLSVGTEPAHAIAPTNEQPKPMDDSNSSELLRLRAEVNRLTRRKQELMQVSAENLRLKAQLASPAANLRAQLPVDYIRKSVAQNRGHDTPEHAMQTFLWALQNKDTNRFFASFTAEAAELMRQDSADHGDAGEFFSGAEPMPGFRILRSEPISPDWVTLYLEFVPGTYAAPMVLKFDNGQWKLATIRSFTTGRVMAPGETPGPLD